MNLEILRNNANLLILFTKFIPFVKVEIILQEDCKIEPKTNFILTAKLLIS